MRFTERNMQVWIARWFDFRRHLIVANVSHGMCGLWYEADLLAVTGSGYVSEIEIKISRSDLRRDSEKHHGHNSRIVKRLYFAVPETMADCIDEAPPDAGFITVDEAGRIDLLRRAVIRKNVKPLTSAEMYQLARLGTMRAWDAMESLERMMRESADVDPRPSPVA